MIQTAAPLLAGVVELGFSQLLKLDPHAWERAKPLHQRRIQLSLQEPKLTLALSFRQRQIQVDATEGPFDASLSLKLSALPQLADPSRTGELLKQHALVIGGDSQIANQFAHWLQSCRPDWLGPLSHWIGDANAHRVGRLLSNAGQQVSGIAQQLPQQLGRYLRDELALLTPASALPLFSSQVEQLQHNADKLERRLRQLEQRVNDA